jgi:cytosine/adenosine deaminase-related metal-dependent hydrolase
VVFHELLGLTSAGAERSEQVAEDWLKQPTDERCVAGLSPHAPYSVRCTLYDAMRSKSAPIATHLAETTAELALLRTHTGPFVDFLKELGVWDPTGLIAEPFDVIRALPHGIFVHGNFLDFGHPHHSFPRMTVRVALGTDSLASNPDLEVLAEARHLRAHYPEIAPVMLLRMLTLNGAEALGFGAVAGSLTAGKSADLVVLPLPGETRADAHDLVLQSALPVARVMFRGEWLTSRDRQGELPDGRGS